MFKSKVVGLAGKMDNISHSNWLLKQLFTPSPSPGNCSPSPAPPIHKLQQEKTDLKNLNVLKCDEACTSLRDGSSEWNQI